MYVNVVPSVMVVANVVPLGNDKLPGAVALTIPVVAGLLPSCLRKII